MADPIEIIAYCNDYEELCSELIKVALGPPRPRGRGPLMGRINPASPRAPRPAIMPTPPAMVPHGFPVTPNAPHATPGSAPHAAPGSAPHTPVPPSMVPHPQPGASPSVPSSTPTPTSSRYKYTFKKWKGRGNPPKQKVGPNDEVTIFLKKKQPVWEAFPEEFFKDNYRVKEKLLKEIKNEAAKYTSAKSWNKFDLANLSQKADIIYELAKKNKIKFAVGTIGTVVCASALYSLFTGSSPESSTEVGSYIAKEGNNAAKRADPSNIIRNAKQLQDELSEVISLSNEYLEMVQKSSNKKILQKLSSDLQNIKNELSFSRLKIEDQSSLESFTGKLRNIKDKINIILKPKVLEKFSKLVEINFEQTEDAEKIANCEQHLADYISVMQNFKQAAENSPI